MSYVLTSSNFAPAVGIGTTTRGKVWSRALGIAKPESDYAKRLAAWGNENEHNAVAAVVAHTGITFTHTGDEQQTEYKRINGVVYGSTRDGRFDFPGLRVGCEVKCPTEQRKTPITPPMFMPQIQGQCKVCDLVGVYFGVWEPREFHLWFVPRSEEYWRAMEPHLVVLVRHINEETKPKGWSSVANVRPVMPEVTYRELTTISDNLPEKLPDALAIVRQ